MTAITLEKPAALASLLRNYSAEVTTHEPVSIESAGKLLPRGSEVFIAALTKDDAVRHVAAATRLRRDGLEPIPHIVARNIRTEADMDDLLSRLAGEAGVTKAMVLGGDRDKPAGCFLSSLALIETGYFQKHGIRSIFIGCYPEGHPRISEQTLDEARAQKIAAAEKAGLSVVLVSQFCFSAEPIVALARRMRALGVTAPFRVGVAGPADPATLVKYAVVCGIGASLRALKERQGQVKSLMAGETPEAVLSGVAEARAADPSLGISGVHFFTFGSLARTIEWARIHSR